MANIGREEDFIFFLPGNYEFSIIEDAGLKVAVNYCVVLPIRKCRALVMGQAKTPAAFVITGDVRNCIRLFRQGIQMRI